MASSSDSEAGSEEDDLVKLSQALEGRSSQVQYSTDDFALLGQHESSVPTFEVEVEGREDSDVDPPTPPVAFVPEATPFSQMHDIALLESEEIRSVVRGLLTSHSIGSFPRDLSRQQQLRLALALNREIQAELGEALVSVDRAMQANADKQRRSRRWVTEQSHLDRAMSEELAKQQLKALHSHAHHHSPVSESSSQNGRDQNHHPSNQFEEESEGREDPVVLVTFMWPAQPLPESKPARVRLYSQEWFARKGVPPNNDAVARGVIESRVPHIHKVRKWTDRDRAALTKSMRENLQRVALDTFKRRLYSTSRDPTLIRSHTNDNVDNNNTYSIHNNHNNNDANHSDPFRSNNNNNNNNSHDHFNDASSDMGSSHHERQSLHTPESRDRHHNVFEDSENDDSASEDDAIGEDGAVSNADKTATQYRNGVLQGSAAAELRAGIGKPRANAPLAAITVRPETAVIGVLQPAQPTARQEENQETSQAESDLVWGEGTINAKISNYMAILKNTETSDLLRFSSGVDWNKVTVKGRTAMECKLQWDNHVTPVVNTAAWTAAEDKRLILIAQQNSARKWEEIAKKLGTKRSPLQCLMRYQRSLNTQILKSKWTKQEDERLTEAIQQYGTSNWQQIAACLEGRTGQQCLHRWMKSVNPNIVRGRWARAEDQALVEAVKAHGVGNWTRIAQHVPGRTDVQCRERWCNVLDPDLCIAPWTAEEDERLLKAVDMLGEGKWSQISQLLAPRTDNQCWRRWKHISKRKLGDYLARVRTKRTALVSNFVGREQERPELTVNDFEIVSPARGGANHRATQRGASGASASGIAATTLLTRTSTTEPTQVPQGGAVMQSSSAALSPAPQQVGQLAAANLGATSNVASSGLLVNTAQQQNAPPSQQAALTALEQLLARQIATHAMRFPGAANSTLSVASLLQTTVPGSTSANQLPTSISSSAPTSSTQLSQHANDSQSALASSSSSSQGAVDVVAETQTGGRGRSNRGARGGRGRGRKRAADSEEGDHPTRRSTRARRATCHSPE